MLAGKELAEKKKLFRSQLSRVRQRARVLEEQVRRFRLKMRQILANSS